MQNKNKRRDQVHVQIEKRGEGCRREFGENVAGPQIDDSDNRLASRHSQGAEIGIVCQDDTALLKSPPEDLNVRGAGQAGLPNVANVETGGTQIGDNLRVNVLIGKKTKSCGFQRGISTSNSDSFLRTRLAYSIAASMSSAVRCG